MQQPTNKGDDPEEEKESKNPNGPKTTGRNLQAKPGSRKRYEKGRVNPGHPAKPPTTYRPRQANGVKDSNGNGRNQRRPNGQKQGQNAPNYSGENKKDKGVFQPAGGKRHRGPPERDKDNQKIQRNGAKLRNEFRNSTRPKSDFEERPKRQHQKRRDEGEKEEEREYIFYSESGVEKWIDKLLSNRRPGESLIEALLQVSLFTCIAN